MMNNEIDEEIKYITELDDLFKNKISELKSGNGNGIKRKREIDSIEKKSQSLKSKKRKVSQGTDHLNISDISFYIEYKPKGINNEHHEECFKIVDLYNRIPEIGQNITYESMNLPKEGYKAPNTNNPINQPFASPFTKGDLIYGLAGERDGLIRQIVTGIPKYMLVDNLNAHFLGTRIGQHYGTRNSQDVSSQKTAIKFQTFLESVLDAKGKPLDPVRQGDEWMVETRLRRSSKLGVLFTTGRGKKIHFTLDQLDMEDVVGKKRQGLDSGPNVFPKRRSITGSELRSIRRNWEHLKDKVAFYHGNKASLPPWEEDPTLWAKYTPKNSPSTQLVTSAEKQSQDYISALCENKTFSVKNKILFSIGYGMYKQIIDIVIGPKSNAPLSRKIILTYNQSGELLDNETV